MRISIAGRIAFFALTAILLVFTAGTFSQDNGTPKDGPAAEPITKEQKEAIEKIVREYLVNNPTVLREAMNALQAREDKEKQEKEANALKQLRNDIYADPDSPVLGNPKGDVAVVVFFDYNCGYCKKSLPELQALLDKDPQLRVIYKEFPILGRQSQFAAAAALAAKRQGQYAPFNHALFAADGAGEKTIKIVSDRLKLDYAKLQQDMADPKLIAELDRNMKLAASLDIDGTPAYVVGDKIIPGAIDIDSLAKLIAEERAKPVNPKPASVGPTKDK